MGEAVKPAFLRFLYEDSQSFLNHKRFYISRRLNFPARMYVFLKPARMRRMHLPLWSWALLKFSLALDSGGIRPEMRKKTIACFTFSFSLLPPAMAILLKNITFAALMRRYLLPKSPMHAADLFFVSPLTCHCELRHEPPGKHE